MPPSIAPGILPIPPNTAATKAFIPGKAPVYGPTNPYEDTNNAPATAASTLNLQQMLLI